MGKEERKQELLRFLSEYNLALPPKAIHRNLNLHRRLFISSGTVDNYLDELVDDGFIARVNPKPLKDGDVVEVGPEESKRAYYLITEAGRERAGE